MDASSKIVVLQRWKFLLLLFAVMGFSAVLSIVVMAKFLLRQEASLFPIVVSATFWAIVFSLLAGLIVLVGVVGAGIIRRSFFVGRTEREQETEREHKEREV